MAGRKIIEVTERSRAEEALRDAETRYRLLFEHSPDGIVIIDPETARPLEFNETAYRQLGYSREEFAALTLFDLEAEETTEETRSRIAQVLRAGRADFETRQRTRQGEIRNVHVTAQIIEILGKSVYHCIWRDITDRKRAEEALARSEEKFRKAFYTSPDSININRLDDGMYVSINPGFTRIMGYTEEEIIGKTSIECNVWENAEDRKRLVAGLGKDGVVTNLEAAFRAKSGRYPIRPDVGHHDRSRWRPPYPQHYPGHYRSKAGGGAAASRPGDGRTAGRRDGRDRRNREGVQLHAGHRRGVRPFRRRGEEADRLRSDCRESE